MQESAGCMLCLEQASASSRVYLTRPEVLSHDRPSTSPDKRLRSCIQRLMRACAVGKMHPETPLSSRHACTQRSIRFQQYRVRSNVQSEATVSLMTCVHRYTAPLSFRPSDLLKERGLRSATQVKILSQMQAPHAAHHNCAERRRTSERARCPCPQ
jgi:hypothetical protein